MVTIFLNFHLLKSICSIGFHLLNLWAFAVSFLNGGSIHCKCDWTDTGAKQGFSQLIVELCRENIGKIPYWLSLFEKQGLSQTQQ